MLGIALAAQLSAAAPKNLRSWFGPRDMPTSVMVAGTGRSVVSIRVLVRPDGNIGGCTVETGSRVPILNSLSCSLVVRRAKFDPARWSDGSPVFGVYRTAVSWIVSDVPLKVPRVSNPDIEVSVQTLPSGIKDPSLVRAMLAVEANGTIRSCTANNAESFERAENLPALIPTACDQLINGYKPLPVVDTTGKPVRSVQDVLVGFTAHRR